jgi:hypothetical protein
MTTLHHGHDEDVVVLDRDEADDPAHLLCRLEDWLRHASDEARDGLAGFFNTAGNGRLAAAGLVEQLGSHAVALHRRLKRVRP